MSSHDEQNHTPRQDMQEYELLLLKLRQQSQDRQDAFKDNLLSYEEIKEHHEQKKEQKAASEMMRQQEAAGAHIEKDEPVVEKGMYSSANIETIAHIDASEEGLSYDKNSEMYVASRIEQHTSPTSATPLIKKKVSFADYSWKERFAFLVQIVGGFGILALVLWSLNLVPDEFKRVSDEDRQALIVEDQQRAQLEQHIQNSDSTDGFAGETYQTVQEYIDGEGIGNTQIAAQTYTRPTRVVVERVGIDGKIGLPTATDITTLDAYLTEGAVHYPGSGSVESGNIFIFGHSTNWAVVKNEAYQIFNGLEDVVDGDEIKLYAGDQVYVYKVATLDLKNENDALVNLDVEGRMLTISTCNSFGAKQDRWVVEAFFDRVESL